MTRRRRLGLAATGVGALAVLVALTWKLILVGVCLIALVGVLGFALAAWAKAQRK